MGMFGSTLFQGAVMVAAVYATMGVAKESEAFDIDTIMMVMDEPEQQEEQPEEEAPPVVTSLAPPPKGFQVLTAPVEIPDVLPDIDLTRRVTNEDDFTGKGAVGGFATGVEAPKVEIREDNTYFEFQVEKPVMQAPNSPQPAYPDILRQAGVEGEALVSFVVDTSGRADVSSFKVIRTTHELFATAVRNALPRMRFIPAEVGDKKVRQLVQQPFSFAIVR